MTSVTADQLISAFRSSGNKQEAIRLLTAFPNQSEIKNVKDSGSNYLIHFAAYNGWTDVVELLVTTYHCDPDCTTVGGGTSLHWACDNNHLSTVKLLTTQYCLDPLQPTSISSGIYGTPLDYSRSGETRTYLQQIICKCACLYVYCLCICTLLKYSKQRLTLLTTLKINTI